MNDKVRVHYEDDGESEDLVARVLRAVEAMPPPVTTAQLAGFDQFHARGLAATVEIAALLDLRPDCVILDAGSGLGGPSRYLAETYGCKVTGIDLTPSFVTASKLLAERTGLSDLVDYEVGDVLALPLPDARFDAAYTQHVVMNIRDRELAYREIRRVLKPGGRFGFYDVLAGDGKAEPYYPVPWAANAATSVLLTEAETRAVLTKTGLEPHAWKDVTAEALEWFAHLPSPTPEAPNLAVVMGPRFGPMVKNFVRALAEGRLRLMMGTCSAQAD